LQDQVVANIVKSENDNEEEQNQPSMIEVPQISNTFNPN
jgi:hypothetical protein